jgi:3-deoxy-D-manno-octulosonic-acid transferase
MAIKGYSTSLRAARRIRFGPDKAVRSIAMRDSAAQRWLDWAASCRTSERLLWIHGASVGELKAANPVVRRIQRTVPGIQIIYTHTSPSVESWSDSFPADQVDYLPLDDAETISRVIATLKPSVIATSRGDLWPGLVDGALKAEVPFGVIGGEISRSSSRLAWPWRSVFKQIYENLSFVCVNTEDDVRRFEQVGTPPSVIALSGDPRVDDVCEQVPNLFPPGISLSKRFSLIAGSTEAADERVLLHAYRAIPEEFRPLFAIVPHDPSITTINRIEEMAANFGLETTTDTNDPPDSKAIRIIARTGILFDLYARADIAYIGGGFKKRGLHSVIEPAVFGLPILFGPHWDSYPEASRLVEFGGAIPLGEVHPSEVLTRKWLELDEDRSLRARVGLRGRMSLKTGAANLTAQTVLNFIESDA